MTPFVSEKVEKERDSFQHTETGSAMDGKEYLRKWKLDGATM